MSVCPCVCVSLFQLLPMSTPRSSSVQLTPAGRFATACSAGDVTFVAAAIAAGASVNAKGHAPGRSVDPIVPLQAAVLQQRVDVMVLLLVAGADPNGDGVLYCAGYQPQPGIMQLLLDAGGDVNRETCGVMPLFSVLHYGLLDTARVVLADPTYDFSIKWRGARPEVCAAFKPAMAELIASEVSERCVPAVGSWYLFVD